MSARQCYHCKQWIEEGEEHDCWTTTEAALTADLSDELREAWERLRDTAAEFGEQRIYASHHSIMFSRKACYFFVRPKKSALELVIFLRRTVKAPQVRRATPASRTKIAHFVDVRHRDQVEGPIVDWLLEAYRASGLNAPSARAAKSPRRTATRAAPRARRSAKRGIRAKRNR